MMFSSYDHFFSSTNTKKEPRLNCVCCSLNEINKTEKTREREASEQKRIGKGRIHWLFKLPVLRGVKERQKCNCGKFKAAEKQKTWMTFPEKKIWDEKIGKKTEKVWEKNFERFIDD